ncbi:c-type cytochrome [Jiella marina]|uniref:c-type cytochrome n=1 Tax=Jiella sp. LLJ827 TaxID=2917712 RepID=UPI002101BF88|nr:cytochrome c [Jiella sp. LLJ827]MCQ0986658.1 cytochrome c [Jiella sp. LLJ827]
MARKTLGAMALTAAVILAAASTPRTAEAQELSQLAAGQRFVEENCSRCHSIARTGESPHAEAPPFRTLSERYPVAQLAEALVEGISTGHPDMPEFIFTKDQANAIIAYLQSIQSE